MTKFLDVWKYREGAEGFLRWVEDFEVSVPVQVEGADVSKWTSLARLTGRHGEFWARQVEVVREALVLDEKGKFKHRVVVLCWPRGEGKSILVCLLQLWKFCCWPRQLIVLGANSKDQVRFVHFDIIRDVVLNSPGLIKIVGRKNLHEKEIRLTDSAGEVQSSIRCISSFSGIVSNITGYTFSEMFDMKNSKFFVQLDGSTRNIPGALGTIDSTVSTKDHQLYRLYQTWVDGKDPSLYFSYRYSEEGDVKDYWNPNQSQEQLASYRQKFLPNEFERYFLNKWSSGEGRIFTGVDLDATRYVAVDGKVNHQEMLAVLGKIEDSARKASNLGDKIDESEVDLWAFQGRERITRNAMSIGVRIRKDQERLTPIESYFRLVGDGGKARFATPDEIRELSRFYGTDWCVCVGLDRADPMKVSIPGKTQETVIRSLAQTHVVVLLKGCIGSRDEIYKVAIGNDAHPYLYVVAGFENVPDHSIDKIKAVLLEVKEMYGGIDSFGSERWGMIDMRAWLEAVGIPATIFFPSYEVQKAAFTELTIAIKRGLFKTPPVGVAGVRTEDVLHEELAIFDHNPDSTRSKFGSPEKKSKLGVQDDAVFTVGAAIYGGMKLGAQNFREVVSEVKDAYGVFYKGSELLGKW